MQMSVKSFIAVQYAKHVAGRIYKNSGKAIDIQRNIMRTIVNKAKSTIYGVDKRFSEIRSYQDFKQAIPVNDYEGSKDYFDRIVDGQTNVCWPGKPKYLAKTSGTTSGSKFIPITKDSIHNHINSAKQMLLMDIYHKGSASYLNGKLMFLSGSPELTEQNGMQVGRLSGISQHHIASYLRQNNLPSFETNCIDDWETKVDAVVSETKDRDMRLISGIPPWVIMYFERLIEVTGKANILELFPNMSHFIYGGVNYEPYRSKIDQLLGGQVQTLETFPASEGFFAYQDHPEHLGLLLTFNSGIFYEFIPAIEFYDENPRRLSLAEVELHVNYVLIVNSNAGLWGYNVGDTIKFVSLSPPRIIVTGRIKHFISAFGEHVIAEEVDSAILAGCKGTVARVSEYHVAPSITGSDDTSFHEWFIAFDKMPENLNEMAEIMDRHLCKSNSYYKDLRDGGMLAQLRIRSLPSNAFIALMAKKGKLGGQNKVPRLANDRTIASEILSLGLE